MRLLTASVCLALALSGCADFIRIIDPTPGAGSRLASLDRNALAEAAVKELMGVGNSVRTERPDPTEAPVTRPVMALTYDDQVYLMTHVFLPLMKDPTANRAIQKARCEWSMRNSGVTWDKSVGEAIDAGACRFEYSPREAYTNPAVKVAFAELLLAHHPKKEQLLEAVKLHAADLNGVKARQICYLTEQRPEPTPAVDAGCTAAWEKSQWNGSTWVYSAVTWVFEPKPIEQRNLKELAETAVELLSVQGARQADAQALLARVRDAQVLRQSEQQWDGGDKETDDRRIKKAIDVLAKVRPGQLYDLAQQRIKLGKARMVQISKDRAHAERERKREEARARAEEARYRASLSAPMRRVYDELGTPDEDDPGPNGGRIWRYSTPVYSNLRDQWGSPIIIGYKTKEYRFAAR